MKRTRVVGPLLVLALGAAGCESLVTAVTDSRAAAEMKRSLACTAKGYDAIEVDVADPHAGDLSNVHKIAVLGFTGQGAVGEQLAGALSAKLEATGRFEVKDRPSVLTALRENVDLKATGIDAACAARVGTALGVDAVVVGEVASLQATDSAANPKAAPNKGTLQKAAGKNAVNLDALLQDVHTQGAKLVVDYRVVSAATGDAVLSRRAEPPPTTLRSLSSFNGVEAPPSAAEVLTRLTDSCAAQMAGEITSPGTRRVEMKFAFGSKLVNGGNDLARAGLLDRAKQRYEEALQAKPQDDAACYNLGLLAMCAGDSASAKDYFDKALALKESPLYMEALKQAEVVAR